MEKKYCIYMHKNKINGKVYIGQTCQAPNDRWKNGKGYKTQEKFYEDIQNFGWDNFEHYILLENLFSGEADEYEEVLIEFYDSTNSDKGYNTYKKNYSGYHFADLWNDQISREKIISTLKKQRNTEEYRIEQSKRMINIWRREEYRQKQKQSWTEERRCQASERTKNNWQNFEYRDKISKAQSDYRKKDWQNPEYRKKICKQVRCLETNQIFDSVKTAAEFAGVCSNTLSQSLRSKTYRAGSHPETKIPLHWEYYVGVGKEVSCREG